MMEMRITDEVKNEMKGFDMLPEEDRTDPSAWFRHFRQIYSLEYTKSRYIKEFETCVQEKDQTYHGYLMRLRYTYNKAWPNVVQLDYNEEGMRKILNRFHAGMLAGPNNSIRNAVNNRFFMELQQHLKKPAEQVFAALIEDCQAAWDLINDTTRVSQEIQATAIATASDNTRSCPHCRKAHPARLCPKAAKERQETIKTLEQDHALDEVPIEDLRELKEDTVKALRETPDNVEIRCWECGDMGHYKRDCVAFLKRMSILAQRVRNRTTTANNFQRANQGRPRSPQQQRGNMQDNQADLAPGNNGINTAAIEQLKQVVISSIPPLVEQTLLQLATANHLKQQPGADNSVAAQNAQATSKN